MMPAPPAAGPLEMYQHDSATSFQFVLRGELAAESVEYLEHAWATAASTLGGKELVVELSGLTAADPNGLNLLSRMRESGARLAAARPPVSPEFLRSLAIPAAAPGRNVSGAWHTLRDRLRALVGA